MFLWEITVLLWGQKGKGWAYVVCLPSFECGVGMTKHTGPRARHWIAALIFLSFFFFFFPEQLSLQNPWDCRDGARRAEPSVVCALHQVFQETFLPGLPAEQCHLQHRKTKESRLCFYSPVCSCTTAQCSKRVAYQWAVCTLDKDQCPGSQTLFFMHAWKMCRPPSAGICPVVQNLSRTIKTCF